MLGPKLEQAYKILVPERVRNLDVESRMKECTDEGRRDLRQGFIRQTESGSRCDSRPIRQDLLDGLVWTEVLRLLEDPALIEAELNRRLAAAEKAEPSRRRQETLKRNLTQTSKSMERLVTAYQEEIISLEELRSRMPELRRREQGITSELQSITDKAADHAIYLRLAETLMAFLERLRSSAETLKIPERQKIIRLLVKEVLVSADSIVIRHSIPAQPRNGIPSAPEGKKHSGDQSYLLCPRRAITTIG